jgi:hypothetical protein
VLCLYTRQYNIHVVLTKINFLVSSFDIISHFSGCQVSTYLWSIIFLFFVSVGTSHKYGKRSLETSTYILENNISSIKACSGHNSILTVHSVVIGDVSNSLISERMSLLIQLIPTVADSVPAFTKELALPMSYITLALFVFVFVGLHAGASGPCIPH